MLSKSSRSRRTPHRNRVINNLLIWFDFKSRSLLSLSSTSTVCVWLNTSRLFLVRVCVPFTNPSNVWFFTVQLNCLYPIEQLSDIVFRRRRRCCCVKRGTNTIKFETEMVELVNNNYLPFNASNQRMDVSNKSVSRIVNFYDNRNVFVTGATGFMGKVKRVLV